MLSHLFQYAVIFLIEFWYQISFATFDVPWTRAKCTMHWNRPAHNNDWGVQIIRLEKKLLKFTYPWT